MDDGKNGIRRVRLTGENPLEATGGNGWAGGGFPRNGGDFRKRPFPRIGIALLSACLDRWRCKPASADSHQQQQQQQQQQRKEGEKQSNR